MRLILLLVLALGCAGTAWPPSMAVGNAGACETYELVYDERGNLAVERWTGCTAFGGPLSQQGEALVRGTLGAARGAAGAVIGP